MGGAKTRSGTELFVLPESGDGGWLFGGGGGVIFVSNRSVRDRHVIEH